MGIDLWEQALAFMDSQVLLTAEEIGVFDHLDGGPRGVPEIAAATGLPADSAVRLLGALCALGIVDRQPDGRFVNGAEASEQLVRGKPGYIGGLFRHVRDDLYPVWKHLREALYEGTAQWDRAFPGQPSPTADFYSDAGALRSFMEGMHAVTYRTGAVLAGRAPELSQVRRLVDVGGASGAFAIALAQAFPRLRGTVFDLPAVRPIAEEQIRRHGLADRLSFQAGDFWEDPLPAGACAYSLGFILHDWDTTGGSIILRKIAAAARPGALLILGEFLLDDDRTGPRFVVRQDLNMLVAARGRERSAAEYRDWLEETGFRWERVCPTCNGKHYMLARRV